VLCPRAIAVLKRQLALRTKLERACKIDHDHLFFKAHGEPIRNLQYPYTRWRQTLARLRNVRYRKPYCARHSSLSWDLMMGRSALWVARQHGHSIATMLRFYAAWTESAIEADVAAIRAAMANKRPRQRTATLEDRRLKTSRWLVRPFEIESAPVVRALPHSASFASGFANGRHRPRAQCASGLKLSGGRERDSNRPQPILWINKLLIRKKIRSPAVPRNPPSWH